MGDDVLFTCDSYLLDEEALALEPFFNGYLQSRIFRTDGVYYSKESTTSLLEKACLRYGSSKQGRIDAVKRKMEYMQRTPLIIIPYTVGAFPTVSSKHLSCVWIFNQPFTVRELGKGKSEIQLLNGKGIVVDVSKHTILNQKNKLHSALHMFEKFRSTQQSAVKYGYYSWDSKRFVEETEKVSSYEWAHEVAEMRTPYQYEEKEE